MASKVSVGNLASEVMKQLNEYSSVAAEGMKKAVNAAGKTVRQEIKATASERTGDYAKSWSVKKSEKHLRLLTWPSTPETDTSSPTCSNTDTACTKVAEPEHSRI